MKKTVLPLLFCCLWAMAKAQSNCPQFNLPVPPSDDCVTAPPFCGSYLNGYCSSNAGYTPDTPGNLAQVFNCSIENNQWLSFVPCENQVTFSLEVGNCGTDGGLEFAVLHTDDCFNFLAVGNCFTVGNGQTATFNIGSLNIGSTYYLMVDGVNGDTCTWRITNEAGVSSGSVLEQDITPGYITGPTSICLASSSTYTAIGPTCLLKPANPSNPNCPQNTSFTCPAAQQKFSDPFIDTLYQPVAWDTIWSFGGSAIGAFANNDSIGSIVTVYWLSPGYATLSAKIVPSVYDTIIYLNDGIEECNIICPDPDPCIILPINVFINTPPNPPILLGPTQICEGQSANYSIANYTTGIFYNWSLPNGIPYTGTSYAGISVPSAVPGNYCATATNMCGTSNATCLTVSLNVIHTVLGLLQLCQDDLPYNFYGQAVTGSGNYQTTFTSWQGCDSIVSQQITVLPPISASITSSTGNSIPVGSSATLDAGSGFASYLWSDSSTSQTLVTDQPGTYAVTVTSAAGCTGTASITLMQVVPSCPNFNLPVEPGGSCTTAPPFCANYLNNYCSSNAGYTPDMPGNLASVIPCTIENNQWLSFVACADSVLLVLEVNSCAGAMGLEFFVLQSADCQLFTAQAACHEILDGTTDTLQLPNLTPGETYYLMVDGIGGDVCNWGVTGSFGISDGVTLQEDNTPGHVTGPTAACAGSTATYTFTQPICDLIFLGGCPANQLLCHPHLDTCVAVQYDTIWHVSPPGTTFVNNDSMGLTVMVTFPDSVNAPPGGSVQFQVSVELVPIQTDTFTCWQDCLYGCATILPDPDPCAILPLDVTIENPNPTTETLEVCEGNCVDFYGQTFCLPGIYTVTDTTAAGCVNLHELILNWIPLPTPQVGNVLEDCNAAGTSYTVSFDVFGFGAFVTVNGQQFNGSHFVSPAIPSGQAYDFEIGFSSQCGFSVENVSGLVTCPPCIGGSFDLGTMALCPGECFDLQGNSYCALGDYQEQLLNPQTNCIETYLFTLTQIVENQLVVGAATEFCDASNFYYSVGFNIEDGTPPYTVNGNPIAGSFYQSGLIPSGEPYAFTITDAATCSPQAINLGGSYTCGCVNNPGTVALTLINQCEGEMAAADFNGDAMVGPGDIQVFILHTASGSTLGSVIGINTTGSFGYVPGLMSYGTTYYISPAVGPDLGGTVDMSSACFSLSPGQPVVFYATPSVEILPADTLTCAVNSLTINSLPSGGSGDFSYAWDGPGGFGSTAPYPTIDEGGTYLLTLTDNFTGCTAQAASAVMSDMELPVFSVTSGEINCQQASAVLEAAPQTSGVSFTWTLPTGDQMTGSSITTNIPGDYTVEAQGPNGCIANAATFVTDNGIPPSLAVSSSGALNCSQQMVQLVASSNQASATFVWLLPDATTATGPSLSASLPGNYTVTATAPNGCTAETLAAVAEGPDPELITEVEATDPTCHGFSDGSIKVLGTTGGTAPYEYSLNGTQTGDFFPDLPAGDYLLSTTDANGCEGLDTVQLTDPQALMVSIGDDQFVNLGQSITLTMQANVTPSSIIWYGPNGETWPDVSELTISPKESGRYTIVISDVSSCRSSDSTNVYVNGQGRVYLPNAFSPNGDNENDRFLLFAGGDVEQVLSIQIFDRWGELVFEDKNFLPGDPAHGWDGRKRGKALDPAVFVVKAMVRFKDGTEKMVTGDVTLLR